MIVPMKKAAGWQPFFISITDTGGVFFPRRRACPKGEHLYQKTEDEKTVLHLFLVENIQQAPIAFVRSIYD